MGEEHLPRRVMFGEMVLLVRQEGDWMGRLGEDLEELGIKSEGWCETAQKAGR